MVKELSTVASPTNIQEALKDPKWITVVNNEMEALQRNDTWDLVEFPLGKKTMGCRFIFTIKLDEKGTYIGIKHDLWRRVIRRNTALFTGIHSHLSQK